MKWNTDKIGFLHQPEYFLGKFDIPQMQERHEKELEMHLNELKTGLSQEADPLKALNILNPKDHIQFLLNNLEEFRANDRLEEALIAVYTRNNGPFLIEGDQDMWEKLFNECEVSKLNKCGKPLPANVNRVYRGLSAEFVRSLAWTPDRKVVEKFAKRWQGSSLDEADLYEVDIIPDNVLVYMQRRHEEIVILAPEFIKTAKIRLFGS